MHNCTTELNSLLRARVYVSEREGERDLAYTYLRHVGNGEPTEPTTVVAASNGNSGLHSHLTGWLAAVSWLATVIRHSG